MSDNVIVALIGLLGSVVVSLGSFGVVSLFGTKFINASRELIRKDIVKDYHAHKESREITQWERESLDREYAGYNDMLPKQSDPIIEDMYKDIRTWKIIKD